MGLTVSIPTGGGLAQSYLTGRATTFATALTVSTIAAGTLGYAVARGATWGNDSSHDDDDDDYITNNDSSDLGSVPDLQRAPSLSRVTLAEPNLTTLRPAIYNRVRLPGEPSFVETPGDVFDRQRCVTGFNQPLIEQQTVLCLGVGGIGCSVALACVRLGVKRIILIDYDVVEPSNLNRQILFSAAHVGKPKASAAASVLKKCHNLRTQIEHYNFDAVKHFGRVVSYAKQCTVIFNNIDFGAAYDHAVSSLARALRVPYLAGSTYCNTVEIVLVKPDPETSCWLCRESSKDAYTVTQAEWNTYIKGKDPGIAQPLLPSSPSSTCPSQTPSLHPPTTPPPPTTPISLAPSLISSTLSLTHYLSSLSARLRQRTDNTNSAPKPISSTSSSSLPSITPIYPSSSQNESKSQSSSVSSSSSTSSPLPSPEVKCDDVLTDASSVSAETLYEFVSKERHIEGPVARALFMECVAEARGMGSMTNMTTEKKGESGDEASVLSDRVESDGVLVARPQVEEKGEEKGEAKGTIRRVLSPLPPGGIAATSSDNASVSRIKSVVYFLNEVVLPAYYQKVTQLISPERIQDHKDLSFIAKLPAFPARNVGSWTCVCAGGSILLVNTWVQYLNASHELRSKAANWTYLDISTGASGVPEVLGFASPKDAGCVYCFPKT